MQITENDLKYCYDRLWSALRSSQALACVMGTCSDNRLAVTVPLLWSSDSVKVFSFS